MVFIYGGSNRSRKSGSPPTRSNTKRRGPKILHLHCDDRENLFSIGFRTPPRDSTGVPHILEHSVLAGSERYPLKDVFNELLRGTLQTFINAFTYPDKTIYPVASQERRDFFNLARVYTDLVLRPRLLKETFLQEGHHLEFDANGELAVSGIVYNEMKGAYSSPEALMYKALQENLYPETPYACDSGGDPEAIPDLTYEQFRAFHRTFYSPTNARIFLYGDIPTEEHLAFLAEMLAGFDRVAVDSSISLQNRWREPRAVHGFYPIDREEKPDGENHGQPRLDDGGKHRRRDGDAPHDRRGPARRQRRRPPPEGPHRFRPRGGPLAGHRPGEGPQADRLRRRPPGDRPGQGPADRGPDPRNAAERWRQPVSTGN